MSVRLLDEPPGTPGKRRNWEPSWSLACGYRKDAPPDISRPVSLAMRIGLRYANRPTPTAEQLALEYPMSRATAYRYVRALKDAKGEA